MSQATKDARKEEPSTPEDTKHENHFQTAQHGADRSGRADTKDANAPQKPVSAYFTFITVTDDERKVRANPLRTDPTENTPLIYS